MCASYTGETDTDGVFTFESEHTDLRWQLTPSGQVRAWSDHVLEWLGYTSEQLATMALVDCVAERCREDVAQALATVETDRQAVTLEIPLLTSDGMTIPTRCKVTPLTDETGDVCGIAAHCRLHPESGRAQPRAQTGVHEQEQVQERTQEQEQVQEQEQGQEQVQEQEQEQERVQEQEQGQEQVQGQGQVQARAGARTRANERARTPSRACEGHTDPMAKERPLNRYQTIVERITDPIMIQDREGNFLFVNDAVTEYSGLSRETLLGEAECRFMDEETAATISENKATVIETEQAQTYEVSPTFEQTGETHTFSTRRYPQYDEDGTVIGTMAICRDVTDQANRNAELELFRTVINSANDSIFVVDVASGGIVDVNDTACHRLGYDREDILALTIADINPEFEDSAAFVAALGSSKDTADSPYRTEHERADGAVVPMEITTAITAATDQPMLIVIGRDITDRQDRETQLQAVDNILRHNLRNDLNMVYGLAGLITEQADEGITAFAKDIRQTTRSLLRTGEKSRTITRLINGDSTAQPVDFGHLVRQVATVFDNRHAEILISVDGPDSMTAVATSRIEVAITELLENAIVHNDAETPIIEIQLVENERTVEVVIADNGPGIPAMDRAVLETGDALGELFHGSGLGLWLVHWIVDRSGGTIAVHDREPQGTEIRVRLPRPER